MEVMRKIVHYVKEYDPKVKLLCGCRDGFIQHNGEEITCKRCIKSLKARGQPFKMQKEFRDPTQKDLFKHRERFLGFKTKFVKIVAIGVAWLKSKAGGKNLYHDGQPFYIGQDLCVGEPMDMYAKSKWPKGEEEKSEDGSLARP